MEPAMAQFESKYKAKVNIVSINVDETETPEFKDFKKFADPSDSIPYTVWLDKSGKILDKFSGELSAKQLSEKTDSAGKKAK